jgi:hypothetical protein
MEKEICQKLRKEIFSEGKATPNPASSRPPALEGTFEQKLIQKRIDIRALESSSTAEC